MYTITQHEWHYLH